MLKLQNDGENMFCQKLKKAIHDEGKAGSDYYELRKEALINNKSRIATAIDMISKQESSHKQFFKSIYDQECK